MFKIFSFGASDIFNLKNINGIMYSFLDNIDINEFVEDYREAFSNNNHEEREESVEESFIALDQYKGMYLLTIDLKGVDIRGLSIRYEAGIIEINLNRSEMERSFFGIIPRNILVKKAYNKKFKNIEEIDTSQILKSVDNGILSIRMQKKYALESISSIVDVECYEDNVDN
jgi:HSP20 family protein